MKRKSECRVYGFDDCKVLDIPQGLVEGVFRNRYFFGSNDYPGVLLLNNDLSVQVYKSYGSVRFSPALCTDHKELLETAKKIYVHDSCRLSRTAASYKYGKCLSPYLADAVVVPTPDTSCFDLNRMLLFHNEDANVIVKVVLSDVNIINRCLSFELGTRLQDMLSNSLEYLRNSKKGFSDEQLERAELIYNGEVLYVPNSALYAVDLLTRTIPESKTVFEETVQESLGNEENKLDLDTILNIREMLTSKDENTVSAGLKALSMLDFYHYSNSLKYALSGLRDYWDNKAITATSVKFMLNHLYGTTNKRKVQSNYDDTIYQQDYDLFRQLVQELAHVSNQQEIDNILMVYEFVGSDELGRPYPHLKE